MDSGGVATWQEGNGTGKGSRPVEETLRFSDRKDVHLTVAHPHPATTDSPGRSMTHAVVALQSTLVTPLPTVA